MKNLLLGVTSTNYKMTSKTSSLKALLLRAWRERWSDLQWGIHIKTILPRGVSGDVHNLADCILQQALVGPGPNQLVLSYLKHTLSSQLVSYAAVLQRISKYDHFQKPHCIISLLDFLQTVQAGITCRGKPEEGVLAGAVLALVHWLLQCLLHVLSSLPANAISSTMLSHPEMFDQPVDILTTMIKDDFMLAMLYLAKHEDPELYLEVVKKCHDIESLLVQNKQFVPPSRQKLSDVLRKLQHLEFESSDRCSNIGVSSGLASTKDGCEPLTYCLQPLLAIEVMQSPCSDTQAFVSQLRMIQRLKRLSNARLYCELMRACLITVNNVLEAAQGPQWGAFTFIKMPQILLQLHIASKGQLDKGEFSQDVVDALELLLQFTPLLDIIDVKWPSSCCVESLLTALLKVGLVQEKHAKKYNSMREATNSSGAVKMEQSNTMKLPLSDVVRQAEPLLARILMTLDADYVEIQEPLLSVMCQVLSSKNFELILAVATVEGKLRTFVSKLIKFNEGSKHIGGVVGKNAQTRAMLFDITFLMLCLIVQMYGSDVVLSEQGGNSFFEQWVRDCMVERGQPKSPEQMVRHYDPNRVNELLAQLNAGECDFATSQVKWHEICWSVPVAIREVLLAWEHEALTPNDVKRILNTMSTRMCCLPICAVAWLCSYMQILPQEKLLKPMNMVQQFLSNSGLNEANQQESFGERFELMAGIICKMQHDVPIAQPKVKARGLSRSSIVSGQPISEQLSNVWSGLQQRGWMQNEATHQLESLLNTGGANWFVTNIVKEMLKYRYQEDLDRAVDLAFAVFHLDLEHCTLALILQVLPQYLHNRLLCDDLIEPQGTALAKLCAYCVFAAAHLDGPSTTTSTNSRKRSRRDDEDLDILGPSSKLLRLCYSNGDPNNTSASLVFNPSIDGGNPQGVGSSGVLRKPLAYAMRNLFNMFDILVGRDGEVSQQTHFVLRCLQLIVQSGKEHAAVVLRDLPNTLVPCLLRLLPDMFSMELLLGLYDVQSPTGRKSATRDLCLLRNLSLKSMVISQDDRMRLVGQPETASRKQQLREKSTGDFSCDFKVPVASQERMKEKKKEINEPTLKKGISLLKANQTEFRCQKIIGPVFTSAKLSLRRPPAKNKIKNSEPKTEYLVTCIRCSRQYKTNRGHRDHLRMHALKDISIQKPDCSGIQLKSSVIAEAVLHTMKGSPSFGEWAAEYNEYLDAIMSLTASPAWVKFVTAVSEGFLPFLKNQNFLFPSSLQHVVLKAQSELLCSPTSRQMFLKLLSHVKECSMEVITSFTVEFFLKFSDELMVFITRSMHGVENTAATGESRYKNSVNRLHRKHSVHCVACSIVKGFLRKGLKYVKSKRWQKITSAIKKCFVELGRGVFVEDSSKAWSAAISRGELTFVGKSALDFFLVLAQLLIDMEKEDGCLGHDAVLSKIFSSPTLLCLWDRVIGTTLSEEDSLTLMIAMCKSFFNTYGRGILKRRMSTYVTKGISSGVIRTRLVH